MAPEPYCERYGKTVEVNQDVDLEKHASPVIKIPREELGGGKLNDETRRNITCYRQCWRGVLTFYNSNSFLVKAAVAILLAFIYPPLGAEYVQPQITATWIAVVFIFRESVHSCFQTLTHECTNIQRFQHIPIILCFKSD